MEERVQPSRRDFFRLSAGAAAGLAGLSLASRPVEAAPVSGRVKVGVEVLLEERPELVRGKRFGLITNATGVLPDLRHEVDVMAADPATKPAAIFAPEHGFRGAAQAGESGGDYADPKTGIPVYDIYGKNRDGIVAIFDKANVDTVVFDIQDVGARFYTYIWTMSDSMEAAAVSGRSFVVLDRPNPIGGRDAEGPVLDPAYSTFVGRYPISQRHGMTVGELARMFNAEFVPDRADGKKVDLTVVQMQGWSRSMLFSGTGQPWVMPSPNMPTPETATVYPGTCMFEGTNLSEGRGTTRPFELIGAPYVDGKWADALKALDLPDADFREAYFSPTFSKHAGKTVGGAQLYVKGPASFDPIRTALVMILEARRLYPDGFAWRYDSWDPERPYWIDKLTGSDYVRTAVDSGKSLDQIVAGWQRELSRFRKLRRKYLIYGGS
jgi:uncharacterized protein YbbC (DUF1343 family)